MNIPQDFVGYLIMCLFGLMIVAINVSLFSAFRNKSRNKTMKMYQSAFDTVKNPWQVENAALDELSSIVKTINPEDSGRTKENNNDIRSVNEQ
ncbi:MAG: hypothetical protein C0391_02920 [Anaerolinea sp.]|nr:hypothetical protein [Anaerolinea sp.]